MQLLATHAMKLKWIKIKLCKVSLGIPAKGACGKLIHDKQQDSQKLSDCDIWDDQRKSKGTIK